MSTKPAVAEERAKFEKNANFQVRSARGVAEMSIFFRAMKEELADCVPTENINSIAATLTVAHFSKKD